MPQSVYVKHLEIPRKGQTHPIQSNASLHTQNDAQWGLPQAGGAIIQKSLKNNRVHTDPLLLGTSLIILLAILLPALLKAYATQKKQAPKIKKQNRHHLIKEPLKTAMDETRHDRLSLNPIL